MAKTTSTTKSAKSKTTKKAAPAVSVKAAKVTKTTKTVKTKPTAASKKATKKTTKVTEKKAVTSPVKTNKSDVKAATVAQVDKKGKVLTFAKLRGLHLLSVGVFIVMALLAGFFMKAASFQATVPHITRDTLSGDMVGASHVAVDVPVQYLVIATLLLSAAFSLWRHRHAVREEAAVARRIMPVRWVDVAVTGALMVVTTALLAGVGDSLALKFLAVTVMASAVFAWIAERENANALRAVRGSFEASAATAIIALLGVATPIVATTIFSSVRLPWYVYALFAIIFVSAIRLGRIQYREYRHKQGRTENYLAVERSYLTLNLLTKIAFAAVLIIGLLKQV